MAVPATEETPPTMLYRSRPRIDPARYAPRALAAVALVVATLGLSACVSGSTLYTGPASTTSSAAAPTVTPGSALPAISRTAPAAVVAGQYISGAAYADAVTQVRLGAAQQAAQQPGSPLPTEAQIRSSALNGLIQRAVVVHYAGQHGITATPAEVQQQYNSIQLRYGTPVSFTQVLKNFGYTPASFKQVLHDQVLQTKVQRKVTPIPTTVQEVRARHILVATKSLADNLYAQLQKDPSKFAALAKKYSTDTSSGVNGGELGYLVRGQTVPAFDQAVFTLKQGQISAPVHTQYGYHIIEVEGSKSARFATLDQQTQQSIVSYNFRQWLNGERKRDNARILVPGVTLSS